MRICGRWREFWPAASFTEAAMFPETVAAQRGSDLVATPTMSVFPGLGGTILQRTFCFFAAIPPLKEAASERRSGYVAAFTLSILQKGKKAYRISYQRETLPDGFITVKVNNRRRREDAPVIRPGINNASTGCGATNHLQSDSNS